MNTELYKTALQWADRIIQSDGCGFSNPCPLLIPINDDRIDIYISDCDGDIMHVVADYLYDKYDGDDHPEDVDDYDEIQSNYSKYSLSRKLELLNKYFPQDKITIFENPKNDLTDDYFKSKIEDDRSCRYHLSVLK